MELCGKDYVLRRLSARGTWHYDFGLSLLQELSWEDLCLFEGEHKSSAYETKEKVTKFIAGFPNYVYEYILYLSRSLSLSPSFYVQYVSKYVL